MRTRSGGWSSESGRNGDESQKDLKKLSAENVRLFRSMVQSIEATHSPTTTNSGPSCGATGMGS